jgi:hypothetical protein
MIPREHGGAVNRPARAARTGDASAAPPCYRQPMVGLRVIAAWSAIAGAAACHVVVRGETTRSVATERAVHPEGAIARRPTVVMTDAGRLRFVEPLECPTEEIARQRTTIEIATRPNLATFTVGVIATTLGGVMLASGLMSSRAGESPYTYLGLASVGAGAPLVIGPWLGNGIALGDGGESSPVRRPGPSQPCGERPLAARAATLEVDGIEVHGAVDRDGVFAIAPYEWLDAYGPAQLRSAAVTATVDGAGGARTVTAVLEAATLANHAASFLAHADFDARVEPLQRVPAIAAGPVRASLTSTGGGPALRVVLPLRNDGPGDAWGLRGQIAAPATPAIDGRMIYVGRLPRGAAVSRELVIPLAARTAAALRGAAIEFSVELRDAHGTAPATPVRFRGPVAEAP